MFFDSLDFILELFNTAAFSRLSRLFLIMLLDPFLFLAKRSQLLLEVLLLEDFFLLQLTDLLFEIALFIVEGCGSRRSPDQQCGVVRVF